MLHTISQNIINTILIKETDEPVPDGNIIFMVDVFGSCSEVADSFEFLGEVCSNRVILKIPHNCETSPDVTFKLDTGIYTLVLKNGSNKVHTTKLKIIT